MDVHHPTNLQQLLWRAAADPRDRGLAVYLPGEAKHDARRLTYSELLQLATGYAPVIQKLSNFKPETIFLLHLDNHLDGIVWFWSVVIAGHVPAVSTPLTNDTDQRRKHLLHLKKLFHDPIIVTQSHLVSDFAVLHDDLNIQTIEALQNRVSQQALRETICKSMDDLAVLMLTSGSTGNAKAVELRHGQLIKAVNGKALYHETTQDDSFLNWIALDHVACLTEVHLHAMALIADQVHVSAVNMLSSPWTFLELIDKHKINYTFAPNFFLASLNKAGERKAHERLDSAVRLDLSTLRALISGGEANVTETCKAVTQLVQQYGAPGNCVRPGFGMTETCAGSIYNKTCPSYDLNKGLEFASLGSAIPGLKFRVVGDDGGLMKANQLGNLEVSGPILFKAYYNNDQATKDAFGDDGWFKTGDRAYVDKAGYLNLSGRAKESIIINGVKYFPHEVETAIEEAGTRGATPSFTVAFAHRPQGFPTEVLCIVYLPTYAEDDSASRLETRNAILEVAVRYCGARPYRILPLSKEAFPKSSLGKLSRAKFRTAFESGAYAAYEKIDSAYLQSLQQVRNQQPATKTESLILDVASNVLEVDKHEIGVNTSLFELGVSSVEILSLKTAVEHALHLDKPIEISTIMANPTIRGLAKSIEKPGKKPYRPTVTLSSEGDKIPLWLVHPGVGEILIFLRLARFLTDRPVHALRARGFDGEPFFQSLEECVTTYYDDIKRVQPKGPYAILGYSYGATLTFELMKRLEQSRDVVKFCGLIDQPPHIQERMHMSNFTSVVLALACFVEIVTHEQSQTLRAQLSGLARDDVLDRVLSLTTRGHLEKFALDKPKLANWADLALNNHLVARTYRPEGEVSKMDVFYGEVPVAFYAKNGAEMKEKHLKQWQGFVTSEVEFHPVRGTHDDILQAEHIASFYKSLKTAMIHREA